MNADFNPQRVYFEPRALDYPLGRQLYEHFQDSDVEVRMTTSHNQVRGIPGDTKQKKYFQAKQTLVVGVRRGSEFQTSKPSADYALPLATGCPGHCEYCYLNTNLGTRSYVRIYVNLEEILDRARQYIEDADGQVVTFEGSCTSDPVVLEKWSHALGKSILFFGRQERGRFRFVTKFGDVSALTDLEHNDHTHVRFSVNADYVIKSFERAVAGLKERLNAAGEMARAGYPIGFMIGPIFMFEGWREQYRDLLKQIRDCLPEKRRHEPTFELITHRFTPKAKRVIQEVYPRTRLPLSEEERQWKWGQFGYGKYVYPKDAMEELREFFAAEIEAIIPSARVDYFV